MATGEGDQPRSGYENRG